MEFSKVNNKLLSIMYNIYSSKIPSIGTVITKNKEAYEYLIDSIAKFPDQETFLQMINDTNFSIHKIQ